MVLILANAGILLIGPLGTNFSQISINSNSFVQENAFESVDCEMAAILSRPQCFHSLRPERLSRHFAKDIFIFKCIFSNENICNSFQISLNIHSTSTVHLMKYAHGCVIFKSIQTVIKLYERGLQMGWKFLWRDYIIQQWTYVFIVMVI